MDCESNYHLTADTGRFAKHNARADFLDGLAVLMGCTDSLSSGFPDGKRPDVLRSNLSRKMLFIGEAKHSESPSCGATQARLSEYLRWMAAHVSERTRVGVFAVCFGKRAHTDGWIETVSRLSREVGLSFENYGIELFEPETIVVWFISGRTSQHKPALFP